MTSWAKVMSEASKTRCLSASRRPSRLPLCSPPKSRSASRSWQGQEQNRGRMQEAENETGEDQGEASEFQGHHSLQPHSQEAVTELGCARLHGQDDHSPGSQTQGESGTGSHPRKGRPRGPAPAAPSTAQWPPAE